MNNQINFTLTFFCKKGSIPCDEFLGKYLEPNDPPTQWSMVTNDEELKQAGIKIEVYNYTTVDTLPPGYRRKINRTPHLDIRYQENIMGSIDYPQKSPLTAVSIKKWALEFVNNTIGAYPISRDNRSNITTTNNPSQIENEDGQKSKKWIAPVIVGGSLFAALCAVVATGNLFGQTPEDISTDNLLLLDNKDAPVQDFDQPKPEVKPITQPISSSNPSDTDAILF